MPTVKFIKTDGSKHELNVDNGSTLMEIGRDNNLGLEGTCGGSLSCATCHVYFSDADFARVGPPSDDEMDMLELAFGLTPTSRLGCQITIDDNLDGLTAKPAKSRAIKAVCAARPGKNRHEVFTRRDAVTPITSTFGQCCIIICSA